MFGINKLKKRIKNLENNNKLLYLEVGDMVKHRFEEIGQMYDDLILKESNDLREEWKQFKKQNKKLFK